MGGAVLPIGVVLAVDKLASNHAVVTSIKPAGEGEEGGMEEWKGSE